MGIYRNENVNSLPEQVQENKENIKQINEILENIDPEQVATILSDIQALKAEQVVQNTAIGTNTTAIGNNATAIGNNTTAIGNEKTAREALIYVNNVGDTRIASAPNKSVGIEGHTSVFIATDGSLINMTNGFILTTGLDGSPHELKFDNTGALTVDGQPIGGGGGGSQLYQHNITLNYTGTSVKIRITFNIINTSSTQLTFADLFNVLNGFSWTTPYTASGAYYIIASQKTEVVVGISKVSTTELGITFFNTSSAASDIYSITSATVTDIVVTL